jgi:hypothetical protein
MQHILEHAVTLGIPDAIFSFFQDVITLKNRQIA